MKNYTCLSRLFSLKKKEMSIIDDKTVNISFRDFLNSISIEDMIYLHAQFLMNKDCSCINSYYHIFIVYACLFLYIYLLSSSL